MKVFEKAGLPKGVGNLVTGFGEQAGQPLVVHKKVRALSFTGSKKIGELITQKAGTKKVGLELGGKNAIIIMDDADLKLALEGVIWGAFGTTGQRCTATSRVILHKSIVGTFTKQLIAKTKKIKLGPGWLKTTDMGPLIEAEAVKKVHRYTLVGKKEGATLLCGGKRLEQQRQGYYYEPTVFADVTSDMRIAREEIFGPTLSLLAFSNLNEAIDIVNSVEYGLSSSIYTKDIRNAFKAIQGMDTGIAYVNSSTIGSEVHLPFGGVKSTGNGTREAGIEGIHEFSETKTVYIDYSGRLQRAQID
jgi:alpha-ketoglutaric semialdehyde dehydrogenase